MLHCCGQKTFLANTCICLCLLQHISCFGKQEVAQWCPNVYMFTPIRRRFEGSNWSGCIPIFIFWHIKSLRAHLLQSSSTLFRVFNNRSGKIVLLHTNTTTHVNIFAILNFSGVKCLGLLVIGSFGVVLIWCTAVCSITPGLVAGRAIPGNSRSDS